MKVGELIKALAQYDFDTEVVVYDSDTDLSALSVVRLEPNAKIYTYGSSPHFQCTVVTTDAVVLSE